jgi:hypothetical protein
MNDELIDEAYALYARINKERSAYFPGQPNRVRLGKLRYRAWKRWERRKHERARPRYRLLAIPGAELTEERQGCAECGVAHSIQQCSAIRSRLFAK